MERQVALDCHKRSIYMLVRAGGKEVCRRRFDTDAQGEAALLAALQPGDRVVLEASTGVFRLASRLESTGATVLVLDPQETRAVGRRGKKTNWRDCEALHKYFDKDPDQMPVVWRPNPEVRLLRQLTRERFAFNQAIVRLKNRVRAVLADEGLQPPCAPWEPEGVQWLQEQTLPLTTRRILERELTAIALDEALKAEQEAELAAFALACPQTQRLMQLTGFGVALAVMWMGEVGELRRFSSAKKLVSYAGLHASVSESGEHQWHGGISKAGRSQLRWIMVEVAWRHVHEGGPEAGYFHRLVERGKRPPVAIVALARRLLVLAYTLLTREATHRELDLPRYEAKLTRLAAQRPPSAEPQPCDRDWAADQLEALTGQPSPRRLSGAPRRTRPRRPKQPRARPSERTRLDRSGRKHAEGSTSAVPASAESTPGAGAVSAAPTPPTMTTDRRRQNET